MADENKPDGPTPEGVENSGGGRKKEEGRGVILSRRGKAFIAMLVALLVCACAYALVTGRDIPAVVASIVSVLMHALLGV